MDEYKQRLADEYKVCQVRGHVENEKMSRYSDGWRSCKYCCCEYRTKKQLEERYTPQIDTKDLRE